MPKKKDICWLHELASSRGGRCLSTEYINNKTKYEWECGCGHRFLMRSNSIQQGQWCPECYGNVKKDINYLYELASLRGGRRLSTEYINSQTKYEWECSDGHRWEAKANDIQQGHWCPECAGLNLKSIELLCEFAANRDGKCLSTEYINNGTKYEWECNKGHGWKASANGIQRGQWCPYCVHRHSKPELQLFEFVKQLYPDAINGQRKLLSNPRFELDIYIPSLQKAIEFDGEFWHSRPEIQERDLQKDQQCQEAGIELLRIQEQYFLDCPQQVFDIVEVFLGV